MEFAERVKQLPPYLFLNISRVIKKKMEQGVDVISFGIGDPDLASPDSVIKQLKEAAEKPTNHRYPESEGLPQFRQAVADFYRKRFNVTLDPATEAMNLIGAKEGIAHIALCLLDPGDVVITPDPSYPVYDIGSAFAGGVPYKVKLKESNRYLVDFADIPSQIVRQAKALWLNYPNNPTGAIADISFFEEAVRFAEEFDLVLLHDACYTETAYEDLRPPSILQAKRAIERSVEFHSLSKTANMTGWRVGMAVGNAAIIDALNRVKSNIDSGCPQAIQEMAIGAMDLSESWFKTNMGIYKRRRDRTVAVLNRIGLRADPPRAGLYIWASIPPGYTSAEFAEKLLEEADVVVTPGSGYGEGGEGYIRLSLTIPDDRIEEGLRRLSKVRMS